MYPFFKKPITKQCYWCGESNKSKLSRDHVPPDAIFPEHERKDLQLITATICTECKQNHHISGEDNIFVCHMLLWANMNSPTTEIKNRLEKCLRTIAGEKTIVETEKLSITLPSGEVEDYYVLKGCKEGIIRILESVARGVYYRMRGEIIPQNIVPDTEFKANENLNINLLTAQAPCIVKKGVFEFKPILYENDDDGERFLCWEFKFYNLKPFPIYYCYNVRNKEFVHK